ncbi:hypothetical protein [Roseomonas sp. 18066]|uniref:hypothetical protein n=1 Tax=Roseomonas sp. 18066 TaxID=2681412 RepID=UPI00135A98B3|nr:hypothetical protein [Roseomonas sp. 18066]
MIYFSERLQLSVDGFARLAPRRFLLCGWMLTPRGAPPQLRVLAGDQPLTPTRQLAVPRPDITLLQPEATQVQGFFLLLDHVPEGAALVLTVAGGGLSARVNLLDAGINRDLSKAFRDQPAGFCFELLKAARDDPARWPLLTHGYRDHGAFAGWLDALPDPQPDGLLLHAGTAATSGGEVMLGLRFAGRPRQGLALEAVALARLAAPDGGDEIVFVPLEDSVLPQLAATACLYARLPADLLPRLLALELVVEIRFDDEKRWLRCRPSFTPLPAFLDAIAALPETDSDHATHWLQPLLARRAAALKPRLDALARQVSTPATGPLLAILTGCDEPAVVPLLEVLAARLEQSCDRLILVGTQSEAAAQVFSRRGRLPTRATRLAGPALAEAIALGAPVVPLDPQRLGQAVIDGALDMLFAMRLQPAELALLQALHDAAGCQVDLADSLARLLRWRRDPASLWQPPAQPWCRPLAGQLINAHLEGLWSLPAPESAEA